MSVKEGLPDGRTFPISDLYESLERSTQQGRTDADFVNLTEYIDGSQEPVEPTIWKREDRQPLLAPGRIHLLFGDSGDGKSWMMWHAGLQVLRAGQIASVVDLEDDPSAGVERLRRIGANDDDLSRLAYVKPEGPLDETWTARLVSNLNRCNAKLCVIDSFGAALAQDGGDENSDKDISKFYKTVAAPITEQTGVALVIVDHITKANEIPMHPSGSKRKRAGCDVAYATKVISPLGKGKTGRVRIVCAKDRHGTFARRETVAVFQMDEGDRIKLFEPFDDEPELDQTTVLRNLIVEVLQEAGNPLDQSTVYAKVREHLEASDKKIKDQLILLHSDKDIEVDPGANNALLYSLDDGREEVPNGL